MMAAGTSSPVAVVVEFLASPLSITLSLGVLPPPADGPTTSSPPSVAPPLRLSSSSNTPISLQMRSSAGDVEVARGSVDVSQLLSREEIVSVSTQFLDSAFNLEFQFCITFVGEKPAFLCDVDVATLTLDERESSEPKKKKFQFFRKKSSKPKEKSTMKDRKNSGSNGRKKDVKTSKDIIAANDTVSVETCIPETPEKEMKKKRKRKHKESRKLLRKRILELEQHLHQQIQESTTYKSQCEHARESIEQFEKRMIELSGKLDSEVEKAVESAKSSVKEELLSATPTWNRASPSLSRKFPKVPALKNFESVGREHLLRKKPVDASFGMEKLRTFKIFRDAEGFHRLLYWDPEKVDSKGPKGEAPLTFFRSKIMRGVGKKSKTSEPEWVLLVLFAVKTLEDPNCLQSLCLLGDLEDLEKLQMEFEYILEQSPTRHLHDIFIAEHYVKQLVTKYGYEAQADV